MTYMPHMRSLLAAILCLLSAPCLWAGGVLDTVGRSSEVLPGFREDSVRARLACRPLHAVEGIWEVAGEGSLMAIELVSESPDLYVMAVVRSADPALRPGTVMGYLTPGASRGQFDTRIYTSMTDEGTLLTRPDSYAARLDDEGGFLSVRPYGRMFRVNWWRLLLPYMYRSVVTPIERPKGSADGFRRVYPRSSRPFNPVYL